MKKLTHSGSYHENTAKSRYLFLSCLFPFYPWIQLLLPMITIEWSQSTNFNRIQDGAWRKSSGI